MRIVCISDTHKQHERLDPLPNGDLLIHCGDFSSTGQAQSIFDFAHWFSKQPHKHKILIAGNHDLTLHKDYYAQNWRRFHRISPEPSEKIISFLRDHTGFKYLEDESIVIEGFKCYGSPWQPAFFNWAFNQKRGTESQKRWNQIPTDTDILITHGPPYGLGDLCRSGIRAGCEALLDEVQNRVRPLVHCFGHIHEGYGQYTDGTTHYINASSCSVRYIPNQEPICFDLVDASNPQR
ncbi:MAG: metallophosphoesterase [Proteobacteria bacterium]|nr:metallophosphoesterase [Pseudomonadota bacterium]